MKEVTTVTCPGYYDGSDDNVQLQFRNNYDSDPRESCTTDYLNNFGDEFVAGQTDVWLAQSLMTCIRNFRPIGGLQFRFITNMSGWAGHDELRLCKVTAQFGRPGIAGYSVWQWTGDLYNSHYSGVFNSRSNWVTMTKIASTDHQASESDTYPETETTDYTGNNCHELIASGF